MELLGQNKVDHRQRKVAIVSQDSFYRVLTPDQKSKALKGQYNFDHPGRPTEAVIILVFSFNLFFKWKVGSSLPLVGGLRPKTVGETQQKRFWQDSILGQQGYMWFQRQGP